MTEVGDLAQNAQAAAIRDAADELAKRLAALADALATRTEPRRMRYGPGRVGQRARRQSPAGFVLDPTSPLVLLRDGRLWSYSRSDSSRFPSGRYYDARTDFASYASSRTYPGGHPFVFLGAVLCGYTFGFAEGGTQSQSPGLWAVEGVGALLRFVEPDEVFAAIATSVASGAA